LQKQWPSSGLVSANEQRQNLREKFQGFNSARCVLLPAPG
jgi:hypothetical protein